MSSSHLQHLSNTLSRKKCTLSASHSEFFGIYLDLATARIDTIRSRLLKLGGRIRVTARRVWLSFASAFPLQDVFEQALANLRAAPVRAPPG